MKLFVKKYDKYSVYVAYIKEKKTKPNTCISD